MSLISQMLKDLEQRHSQQKKNPTQVLHGLFDASSLRREINLPPWGMNIAIGVLSIILLFLIIRLFHHANATPQQIVATSVVKKKQLVASSLTPTKSNAPIATNTNSTNAPSLSALVHAIGISGDSNYTRLTVYLNKNIHYKVERDLKQNKLILFLDNTQLAEPLLPLNTRNTAIKDVQVNNVGSQLQVVVALNAGFEIQNLQLENQQEAELIIDLANKDLTNNMSSAIVADNNSLATATVNKLPQAEKAVESAQAASIKHDSAPLIDDDTASEDGIQKATNLVQAGQINAAIGVLINILQENPDQVVVRQMLADLLIRQRQLVKAAEIVHQGLVLQPTNTSLLKLAAQIYILDNDKAAALATLKKATPVLTDDPDYYSYLADLSLSQGDAMQAAKYYGQLTEAFSSNGNYWVGFGMALDALGRSKDALEAYQNADNSSSLSASLKDYADTRIRKLEG